MLNVGRCAGRPRTRSAAIQIKTPSIDDEVRTLSGGNQQKVQIARWLAADARILILIDPTRASTSARAARSSASGSISVDRAGQS